MLFPGQAAQPASRTGTPSKSDFATEAEAIRVLLRRAVATLDLVKAASTENLVAARDALAAGANPNYVNGRGQSALSFALYRGDIPMLDLLLKPPVPALPVPRPTAQAASGRAAARIAASVPASAAAPAIAVNPQTILAALKSYISTEGLAYALALPGLDVPKANLDELLGAAVKEGNPRKVELLFPRDPKLDANRWILEAARTTAGTLTMLLKYGGDPNHRGGFPGETDERDLTPLIVRVWKAGCTAQAVNSLLAAGADPNHKTSEGRAALHFATGECLLALLAAKPDIEIRDDYNNTPLLKRAGAMSEFEPFVRADIQALLNAGANPAAVNKGGQSVRDVMRAYQPSRLNLLEGQPRNARP